MVFLNYLGRQAEAGSWDTFSTVSIQACIHYYCYGRNYCWLGLSAVFLFWCFCYCGDFFHCYY